MSTEVSEMSGLDVETERLVTSLSSDDPDAEDSGEEDVKALLNDVLTRQHQLEDTIEELRHENQELRDELAREEQRRQEAIQEQEIKRSQMLDALLGSGWGGEDSWTVRDEIAELRDEVRAERQTRAHSYSLLRQRISHTAERAGVSIDADALAAQDKLVRLVRQGAEAVVSTPYEVHRRARTLLLKITNRNWRNITKIDGTRVVEYLAPDVQPLLTEHEGNTIQSNQIARTFDKVDEMAADSSRIVKFDKKDMGDGRKVHRLRIWSPRHLEEAAREVTGGE